MGIFRTKKLERHSAAECQKAMERIKRELAVEVTDELLHEWAEWRECLARIEGKNGSPLD